MGYATDFEGSFQITPTLKEEHKQYLITFSKKRRMKRDAIKCEEFNDYIRQAAGLPIGIEGEFTVFGDDSLFTADDYSYASVIDNNLPPSTQPGLWCQWIPMEDGNALVWDGAPNFYNYIEWLEYLKTSFFEPWGYTLSGTIKWEGQGYNDKGTITVDNNIITTKKGWNYGIYN